MNSKTKLTGRVIFRDDLGYEEARQNWNPFSDSYPYVFVFVQNQQDVSNAINLARENNVPLRARSGRHALEREMSQVKNGIVIDVSDMNGIRISKDKKSVFVETGNDVGPIVKRLAKKGYMFPFGDSPSVGIGGITLGGGIGPLQRTVGLISDNLIGMTMIDAQGKVIRANENENSDLLWASQGGGGGNFGITIEYEFKLHRALERVSTFKVSWNWEQLDEVFKAWQMWAPFTDYRLGTYMEIGSKSTGSLSATGLFLGPKEELIKLIEPLTTAGTPRQRDIKDLTWSEAVDLLLPSDPIPDANISKFSSAYALDPWPDNAIKSMREFLEKATGNESNFFFLNWGGAVRNVSPDATAFYWRTPMFYTEWSASWKKHYEEHVNIELVDQTRENLKPFIKGSYINVPDQHIKNYGQEYYGMNFARLRKIKEKYDPMNVFCFPQSIPPCFCRE